MTIEEQIANIDRGIKDHEAALAYLNEKRRELVNRGNLNKPYSNAVDGDYRNGDFYEDAE